MPSKLTSIAAKDFTKFRLHYSEAEIVHIRGVFETLSTFEYQAFAQGV